MAVSSLAYGMLAARLRTSTCVMSTIVSDFLELWYSGTRYHANIKTNIDQHGTADGNRIMLFLLSLADAIAPLTNFQARHGEQNNGFSQGCILSI